MGALLSGSASAQSTGTITTVAGGGPGTMPAVDASLRGNVKVASDTAGNLYVSDGFAHRVYRFDRQSGNLSAFAGTGFRGSSGDGGPALQAQLGNPYSLALDQANGVLYVQDGGVIRAVAIGSGEITRFAGGGSLTPADGVPASQAFVGSIQDVAVDAQGVVYLADMSSGGWIWAVENGVLRAVAGNGVARGAIDGPGGNPADDYRDGVAATSASLGAVSAVAVSGQALYFYEQAALADGGARYRRVDLATGTLTTYAGNGYVYGSFDGLGGDPRDDVVADSAALQSALAYTPALAVDPVSGDLYGLIYTIGLVRRVSSNGDGTAGTIATVFGGGAVPPTYVSPSSAALMNPTGLGLDGGGALYVAAGSYLDFAGYAVYESDGSFAFPVVGNGYAAYCGDGGPATGACLAAPTAARPDAAGQLWIADDGNRTIRQVTPGGDVASLMPFGRLLSEAADLWPLGGGRFLFSSPLRHTVYSTEAPYDGFTTFAGTGVPTGSEDGEGGDPDDDLNDGELAWVASLKSPAGLVRDAQGNTFIADSGNHRVRRVDAVTGVIQTIAGTGAAGHQGTLGLPATATDFLTPYGLAFEADGDLLVAERDGHRVRRIRAGSDGLVTGNADETVEHVAGAGPSDESGYAGDGGPATSAFLNTPTGLAVDALGHIYIADSVNHAIRRIHAQTGIIDTIAGRGDGGDGVPAVQSRLEQIGGLSTEVVNGESYLYVTDLGQNRIRRIDLGPATGPVNEPPVIEAMTNDGAVVTATAPAGVLFGLYVLASDPDGDLLSYTWSGPFGSASGLGTVVRMPIGVNTVTVAVDDGHGHVVTGTATITVIGENTFTGSGEVVAPPDDDLRQALGETPGRVTVQFLGPVTTPGLTWLRTRTDQIPPPPAGKQLGSAPLYYDVATTATATGDVRICLDLTGMSFAFPEQVELHRLAGAWTGLGVSPDPMSHQVCVQAPFAQVFGTYANFTPADPASIVATIAGTGTAEDTGDGGPANQAGLNIPTGLAFDRARNLLYIGEGSHRVRRVNLGSGTIETIAGNGAFVEPVDGVDARLSSIGSINGVAVDADGNLFVSDPSHCSIRRVDAQTNVIATVAGSWRGPGLTCGYSGDGGPATAARLGFPYSLAFDSSGNLYFSEQPSLDGTSGGYVRRIAAGADGRITGSDPAELIVTVAGNGQQGVVSDGVHPLDAGIFPWGVAVGPGGGVYVAESNGVLRLSPGADGVVDGSSDETVTRVLGSTLGFNLPFQGDGGPAQIAFSAWPSGIAVLPSGDVLVADRSFRRIRRVSAGADGVVDGSSDELVTTIAGFSDDSEPPVFDGDGYALTTRFAFPTDVIHDGADAIYVSDPSFHRVRRMGVPSGGGGGGGFTADLSIAASAAPDPVGSGSLLTHTVTVTNLGPQSAHGVQLSVPIAATVTFVGSSPAGACTGPAAGSAGAVVCGLGDLDSGQSTVVTIETRPTAAGPLATTLTVSASETDPSPSNNSATVSVAVTLDPVVLDVLETIVVSDAPQLTPSVMLNVPESIVVTDAPGLTPAVMLEVPETIVVSDTPSVRDATPPTVTIDQSAWQADPTSSSPIEFTVVFSEPVTGFDGSDVSFAGSTVGGTPTASVTGAGSSYIVSVTGLSGAGTVVASISQGAAVDVDGNFNVASTSTDNSVTLVLASVPTTTSLASSRNPSLTTAPPIFTATVASEQPGVPPTGQVEFRSDGVVFGRSALFQRAGQFVAVQGGAHLAVAGSPHAITAHYVGDAGHLASDSAPVEQVVHEGTYYVENVAGPPARLAPVALNDAGQIAGNLAAATGSTAGVFDPVQGYRRLDAASDFSEAFDLNASGTVVGRSGFDAATTTGFADRSGVLELVPASRSAVGVNGREQIAINLEDGSAGVHHGGGTTALDAFEARAINDVGVVAGAATAGDGQPEAVVWESGALLRLGRFGQALASAARVNNAGTVLVQTGDLAGEESALLYRDGVETPLGTGRAWDMNDADVVVAGTGEARVHVGDASIRLANGPIAGMAVNDRGEIVGSVANQLKRWTPVPTSALAVSPVTGFDDDETTLTATLTSRDVPVAGQPIAFSLNGRAVGSATTGANGVATLSAVTLGGLPIGVLPEGVRAFFAGSASLGSSTATASLTIEARNPADVSVSAAALTTGPITVGSNVTYAVTMTNHGPSSVIELRLNVTLPAGVQYVSHAGQGACSWSPGLGTCDFGNVAVGTTRTMTVVARPLASGPSTVIFAVSTPQFDPAPLNNTRFVTIDPAPTVTIDQAPGQPDPTSVSPIGFSVAFSEPVTGFSASDVSFAGSLAGQALTATVTGSGASYNVSVTGMSAVGLVAVSIPAGAAVDSGGNPSLASTSTDRTVLYQPNTAFGYFSPSNGGNVVLALANLGGRPSGLLSYTRGSMSYTATRITSFVISGQTATFEGFSGTGRLFVATAFDGGSGQPDRFRLWIEGVEQTPPSGAIASGTLVIQPWAAETRLKGWVDLHTHPMSNVAFGGKLFHGAPSVGSLMPAVQMPGESCRIDERARSIAEALANDSFTRGVASCGGNLLRALMIQAVEGAKGAQSPPAGAEGYPAFADWPRWNDVTHQKMWVDWIRRSWQHGQRVMVALSHNNRSLADVLVMGGGPITGVTGDEASSALQISEIKRLVAANVSFMAVARTPAELRSIVQSDRMAVVLGVELDNLGDLNRSPALSEALVDQKIQELFDADVRYVLPIHFTDNVFGDAALHSDFYNVLNLRETGSFFRVGCAAVADEVGYQATGIPSVLNLFLPPGTLPPFIVPSCLSGPPGPTQFTGHVNASQRTTTGLTSLGEFAIRAMMKRGMIVDIDHMSDRAANRTLALATAVPSGGYPLMSGHSGVRERSSPTLKAENSRTTAQLARVACLGGMFGLGTDGIRADDWAAQYARAYDVMRRAFGPGGQCPQSNPLGVGLIGLGTDTNSLVMTPRSTMLDLPPRFSFIYDPSHPANAGVSPLAKSKTGTREWDYNFDGVAHYGMFADFLRDVRTLPGSTSVPVGARLMGRQVVDDQMMYGADYFYRSWLKADSQKIQVP